MEGTDLSTVESRLSDLHGLIRGQSAENVRFN